MMHSTGHGTGLLIFPLIYVREVLYSLRVVICAGAWNGVACSDVKSSGESRSWGTEKCILVPQVLAYM